MLVFGAPDASMMNFGMPLQGYPSFPMVPNGASSNVPPLATSASVPKPATLPPAGPNQNGQTSVTSWQPLYTHNGNPIVLYDSTMSARLPYQVFDYPDSLVVEVCTFGLAISRLNAQYNSLFISLTPEDNMRIASHPIVTFKFGHGALLFQATTDFDERIEASPSKGLLTVRFKKNLIK